MGTQEARLRAVRRQLAVWAVITGVAFAGFLFAAIAAASNGTSGAAVYGLLAALALAGFVWVQVIRSRAGS